MKNTQPAVNSSELLSGASDGTTQHTPRPWAQSADGFTISSASGDICQMLCSDIEEEHDRCFENAALICAAPELLEACKAALDYCEVSLGDCEEDCECIIHALRSAVTKAEAR